MVFIASFFNLYTENIRQEVLEPLESGEEALEFDGQFDLFSIIGTLEPNLGYADDSVLLLNFKDGFRSYLKLLYVVSKNIVRRLTPLKLKL